MRTAYLRNGKPLSGKTKDNQGLTVKERTFADAMARTGDKEYSLKVAGYAPFAQTADKLMRKDHVIAEVRRRAEETLVYDILPLAVDRHKRILADDSISAGAHNAAIKLAYEYGFQTEDGHHNKEPHEMSADEIAKAIEQLEREASTRAKDASQATQPDNGPAQSDVFE